VTQLIARRVRESGVYCEIAGRSIRPMPPGSRPFKPKGIILSGGPPACSMSQIAARAADCIRYGRAGVRHLLRPADHGAQLGGKVEAGHSREFGRAYVEVTEHNTLFDGVWDKGGERSGLDEPRRPRHQLPPGFRVVAISEGAPFAVIADETAASTACSSTPKWCTRPMARRCCELRAPRSAAARGDWTMAAFREEAIAKIRAQVGGPVICGLSGGVDSSVAAVLIHEAIGDQLTCVFVDHGLMRAGESEQVVEPVPRALQHPARARRRVRLFLGRSRASPTPRKKRKIIGGLFIDVFEAKKREDRRRGFPRAGHALSRT
jgi:GMP synthase (glutamine-hydrolysing)